MERRAQIGTSDTVRCEFTRRYPKCCWTKIQTSLLWSPSSPCSPKLAAEPVVLPVSSVSLSCSTSRKCGKSGGLVDEQTRLTSLGSLSKYRLMCHR
ncbi:uncharacterized protein LOC132037206 isoform X2 [Lycium ferocissimum]|uniref:uncharacterized protein LOC132037206 isoform X2 n=1 Tax=Lycium ferocissimum TaxID=112874 RepID=UPI002814EE28|nr:uncharacterized protein LOC132037206 isoform X2 [Lycium ferocissimum]